MGLPRVIASMSPNSESVVFWFRRYRFNVRFWCIRKDRLPSKSHGSLITSFWTWNHIHVTEEATTASDIFKHVIAKVASMNWLEWLILTASILMLWSRYSRKGGSAMKKLHDSGKCLFSYRILEAMISCTDWWFVSTRKLTKDKKVVYLLDALPAKYSRSACYTLTSVYPSMLSRCKYLLQPTAVISNKRLVGVLCTKIQRTKNTCEIWWLWSKTHFYDFVCGDFYIAT